MNYDSFVAKYNGKPVEYDGAYLYQCVDLVKQYLHDCFGINPGTWGNASNYYTNPNPTLLGRFTKIANGATNVPSKGDIVVYSSATPGSGGAGHIEIFDHKAGAGTFVAFSQNWGGQTAHFVTHADNYKYVLGWFTPIVAPSAGNGEIMDTDAKVGRQYNTLRGNTGTAGERASWIGKPYDQFNITAVPEVNAREQAKKEAQVQFASMQSSINQLNQSITAISLARDEAINSGTKTKEELVKLMAEETAQLQEIAKITSDLETAHDQITELQNKPTTIPTGKSFFDVIKDFFSQFKKG